MVAATSVTSLQDELLFQALKRIFLSLSSYKIIKTISQANAEGYIMEMQYYEKEFNVDESSDYEKKQLSDEHSHQQQQPEKVFVKHVDASVYLKTKKNWNDLRRTLMYARTEARTYSEFAPLLRQAGFNAIPYHYAADFIVPDNWINDNEHATKETNYNTALTIDQLQLTNKKCGGLIVLECIDDNVYYQDSPISINEAKQCLNAVAALHVAAWENITLLDSADKRLSKSSFHLETRNPSELDGIEKAWDHFCFQFENHLKISNLWTESVQNLGRRIKIAAGYISEQVTPSPTDQFATIIHGDYKAMNVFLSKHEYPAKIVDFASIGIGLGMSDVAMHIHHAILPEHLETGEEELVRYYWEIIVKGLPENKRYPWVVAWKHYQFAVVDYYRFLLGRFWKSATVASMEAKSNSKNTCLLNRNVSAAMAYVRRVDTYLQEIEAEMGLPN